MDSYRELIRENIGYDDFVRERPCDTPQLDEMVELTVEAACSRKETVRVAGNDFSQAVVKSRLLKLDGLHIRFVFDCLWENTMQARNMSEETGRPPISSRMAFGAVFINAYDHLTDERTVQSLQKNLYMQYSVGLHEFQTEPLFDPSMMVHFRKRFPVEEVAKINE